MLPSIKLYVPIVVDHQKSFELHLPGVYPYKQALAIALKEKEQNPYVGSISLRAVIYTARQIADLVNSRVGERLDEYGQPA